MAPNWPALVSCPPDTLERTWRPARMRVDRPGISFVPLRSSANLRRASPPHDSGNWAYSCESPCLQKRTTETRVGPSRFVRWAIPTTPAGRSLPRDPWLDRARDPPHFTGKSQRLAPAIGSAFGRSISRKPGSVRSSVWLHGTPPHTSESGWARTPRERPRVFCVTAAGEAVSQNAEAFRSWPGRPSRLGVHPGWRPRRAVTFALGNSRASERESTVLPRGTCQRVAESGSSRVRKHSRSSAVSDLCAA